MRHCSGSGETATAARTPNLMTQEDTRERDLRTVTTSRLDLQTMDVMNVEKRTTENRYV